jgi:hypothetical protein
MPTTIRISPPDPSLEVVIALGAYTRRDDSGLHPRRRRTDIGTLVNQAKYWRASPGTQERARDELGLMLVAAASEVPELVRATAVVAVPGHDAGVESFSQRLGRDIAQARGLPLVHVEAATDWRQPVKTGLVDLAGFYEIRTDLTGHFALIVDDVFDSGSSLATLSRAAMSAGAMSCLGLVAARRV